MCTVGAHLDVRHLEPTPIGAAVRAVAELIESDGPRLRFRLQVLEGSFGEGQLVGDGTHQRVIVNVQRFIDRAARKVTETP
jgi:predicted thioesterase